MILKTLEAMGPLHGYGIARRIEQVADGQIGGAVRHDLPGPIEAGAGGPHFVRMGSLRYQSPRQILQFDPFLPQTGHTSHARLAPNDSDSGEIPVPAGGRIMRRFLTRIIRRFRADRHEREMNDQIEGHFALYC
jgi:hypothetical protein